MKSFFIIISIIIVNIIALAMVIAGALAILIFFTSGSGDALILIGGVVGIIAGILFTIFLHLRYDDSWFSIFNLLSYINFY
jgi:hypothetical protein